MNETAKKVMSHREQKQTSRAPGIFQPPPKAPSKRPPDALTPREYEILQLVWAGLTNRAIAHQLHISIKTGEAHRANMMRKFGVSNMAQLLNRAVHKGLLVDANAAAHVGGPIMKQTSSIPDGNSSADGPALRGRSRQRKAT